MHSTIYNAIYDFGIMPYALGDVLTWNVQTAIQCELANLEKVNINIILDSENCASIYQKEMIRPDNFELHFNELFSSFGTHPNLGNIFIYRSRKEFLESYMVTENSNQLNLEAYNDYLDAINNPNNLDLLVSYFTKYIYYHERINKFAYSAGRIPLLKSSLGCEPDISGLLNKRLAGKHIVIIHPRLRKLDIGYAGNHTHSRDSDFLEWYNFLKHIYIDYPDIQFVLVGRLQEKPIEFLRLPNVISLRSYGFGLGHELTLMLRANLFIGTSSGFAAMANFTKVPYFITKMNTDSCKAYQIPFGCDRLPFSTDHQLLIYESESSELLSKLLIQGLKGAIPPVSGSNPILNPLINEKIWEEERQYWLIPGATTSRFQIDDTYVDKETAFLISPQIKKANDLYLQGKNLSSHQILESLRHNFPRMTEKNLDYKDLEKKLYNSNSNFSFYKFTLFTYYRILNKYGQVFFDVYILLKKELKLLLWYSKNINYIYINRKKIPNKISFLIVSFYKLFRKLL